jgi:DNA/RNA-binding domain of Phe-tRNA-synthetase-like protein
MATTVAIAPHPVLEVGAFVTRFAQPICESSAQLERSGSDVLEPGVNPPFFAANDAIRGAIRALLRHGGFKPAGRSKPSAEYLVAAHAEGRFPRINPAVDACNIASLWSGLPISLVDLDRVAGDLRVQVCPQGTTYVFNPSGQIIDASGLLALYDADGPTGTPVKDAQRTKTHDATKTTLSVVWGSKQLPNRTHEATTWYRQLVASIPGATLEDVVLR